MEKIKCSVENFKYKSSTEFGICKFHLNHRKKREEKEKLLYYIILYEYYLDIYIYIYIQIKCRIIYYLY